MGGELDGRVAVVTGGSSGIGRATVELFVAQGARVVVADVDRERGEDLAAALGDAAAFRETDVADPDQVAGLVAFAVARFGGLHVMCNNAGVPSSFRRLLDNELADFQRVMAVNVLGVLAGMRHAARHMVGHGGGAIVNTASMGALTGGASPIVYRASKAAVLQATRSAAIDLAEHGIRVNGVAPGHVATGITGYDLGRVVEVSQPLQREGTPGDVAEVVLFLASDRAAHVTGVVVPVDGGTAAGPPVSQMKLLMSRDRGGGDDG